MAQRQLIGWEKTGMARYLSAETLDQDDFGAAFLHEVGEVVYDGKTKMGPWATMSEASFGIYGVGLGLGLGQKYVRDENGHLNKVEG